MVEEASRNGYPESDQFDDVPPGFSSVKSPTSGANVDLPPGFQSTRRNRTMSSDETSDAGNDHCFTSLAPANENLEPFSDFEADEDNYDQGQWWYVCVELKGAPVTMNPGQLRKVRRDIARLPFGEMVWVCERGFVDGVCVLHLGDGRGWVNEINAGKRWMSECFREELEPSETFTSVGKAVVFSSPCYSPGDKNSTLMEPGELMLSRERATVLCKGKRGEEHMTFYKIDSRAGGAYSRKTGWCVESANGAPVIAPIRIQEVETPEWYLVVHERGVGLRSGPTISDKARLGTKDTGIPYGEFVCIEKKAYQNDLVFLKLKNGGWAFEAMGESRAMVRVVSEVHLWTYSCCDKQGAEIRKAPCRVDNQKTGRKIKHRQRIVVIEKARVGDEVFLRCAPPIDGWVTESKRCGERKMRPMHPTQDAPGRGKPPGMPQSDFALSYSGSRIEPASQRCMDPMSLQSSYPGMPQSSYPGAPQSSYPGAPQSGYPGMPQSGYGVPQSGYPSMPQSGYGVPQSSSYPAPSSHYRNPSASPRRERSPHPNHPSSSVARSQKSAPSSQYPSSQLFPPGGGYREAASPHRYRETPPAAAPRHPDYSPAPHPRPQTYPQSSPHHGRASSSHLGQGAPGPRGPPYGAHSSYGEHAYGAPPPYGSPVPYGAQAPPHRAPAPSYGAQSSYSAPSSSVYALPPPHGAPPRGALPYGHPSQYPPQREFSRPPQAAGGGYPQRW